MLPTSPPRARGLLAPALTVLLVVGFCLALFGADPLVFWNDDYQISILPVLTDIARSWHEGHWPLLSPYSWACGNLAGEYQYGTFSVFVNAVVVAVWQWPLSFGAQAAAMSIVHLAVLAAGTFLLARQRRLPDSLAVLAGIVAALNGWEIGWGATNWFGALAAHAWLPWAWWAFEVAMEPPAQAAPARSLRCLLPAPFVYLVLTGGFPYTVVMLVLVSAWLGAKALFEKRLQALRPLALGWTFGLGLSAPAWLSLLAAIRGSSRAEGVGPGNHAWTVPLSSLPGAILPDWSTPWHNFSDVPSLHAALELAGAFVPVVGLLAGLFCCRARLLRTARWDFGLLGVVLLLCVLPSPGMFRWSFRWLPLLYIVLALVGGRAWQLVASSRDDTARTLSARSWAALRTNGGFWATVAVLLVWLAMAVSGTANPDPLTRPLPMWTLGCALAWFGLEVCCARRDALRGWLPALFALLSLWVTYRHLPTNCGLPKYAFDSSLSRPGPLSPDRLYLSFYPAPEKFHICGVAPPGTGTVLRPGSTNLFAGLKFLNGYSPIMGPGIGRELKMNTHGEIPPEVAREIFTHEAGPHGELARLGVDGLAVASNYPLDLRPPADEWTVVFSSPEGVVYHRRGEPLPSVSAGVPPAPPVLENSRQRVVVDVSMLPEGLSVPLEFHRPYFPGYEAALDGVPVAVRQSDDGNLPTVRLPAGRHSRLVLSYRPRAVVVGASLAGLTAAAMLLTALSLRRAPVTTD